MFYAVRLAPATLVIDSGRREGCSCFILCFSRSVVPPQLNSQCLITYLPTVPASKTASQHPVAENFLLSTEVHVVMVVHVVETVKTFPIFL